MDKNKLLNDLKTAIVSGLVSKDDVAAAVNLSTEKTSYIDTSVVKRIGLSEIFYYIGGIIILIGLIVLVGQNWLKFSYAIKVLITLGMGIALFASAIFLSQTDNLKKIGVVFYLLSAILIPFGYFVLFGERANYANINFYNTLIPFLCLLQFGIAQFFLKNNVFTVFNTIFGTWLFFGLTNNLISNNPGKFSETFHLYQVILVGISYLLIGYYLKAKEKMFNGLLNFLGTAGILGAGFILNVMASNNYGAPQASVVWVVLYPILVVAAIVSSVYIKNSAFLFVGTICLIGYIIRITAQYFSNTLGWPFALIVMGIAIMALGYLAFYLNKNYIKK